MNWRERLADWISGGDFARARRDHHKYWVLANKRGHALMDVVDQETPSANATVKRMARIAREALE